MNYTSVHHAQTYPSLSSALQPYGTVLITGGGTGIGAATAHSFGRSGTRHVILIGRRPDPLASAADSIRSAYPETKVTIHAIDVLSTQALGKAFEEAGRVDVVIHAASVLPTLSSLADLNLDMDAWWKGFEVNVRGTMNVARALIQSVRGGDKKAVFVSLNTAGTLMPPLPGMGGYIASKLGLFKMMDYFGVESGDKVRMVSVHPGLIRTDAALRLEEKGLVFPYEDISLPADFLVWVAGDEAAFLANRFVSANWDIDELKARKDEIVNGTELTLGLKGVPRTDRAEAD